MIKLPIEIITYETDQRIWFIDHHRKLMGNLEYINQNGDKILYDTFILNEDPYLKQRKILIKYE